MPPSKPPLLLTDGPQSSQGGQWWRLSSGMRVIDLLTLLLLCMVKCFHNKSFFLSVSMILKVKMKKKSPYLIVKKSRGTRVCRHQPLTASVETSQRKIDKKPEEPSALREPGELSQPRLSPSGGHFWELMALSSHS